ncbi:MAG: ATP-binding protein [Mariprofundaceae bacterium]|nr:ATP-binding protein [Mariprofundaceae bacterium]
MKAKSGIQENTAVSESRIEKALSRFLLFTMAILLIYIPLNMLNGAPLLALIQSFVLLVLPILYIGLKRGFSPELVKHGIGFCALIIFVSLLFNPSIEDTGIYWIFGYPLVMFFFLGLRTGLQWTVLYFCSILLGMTLAYLGYLHLYFSYAQVSVALLELFFFSVIGYFFVSDNEQAEQKLQRHLHYLQSIERVETVMHADLDVDESMREVLKVILEDFQASRVWLLYPCNPDSDFWSAPYEQTVPEYPGALEAKKEYPINDDVRQIFSTALQNKQPVCYPSRADIPDKAGVLAAFSIQSQMVIALHPDTQHAWLLGMHQCDAERQYSHDEQRLFHDIAKRLEDALNQKLLYRDLNKASQKANAANHAKTEFLSVMSHELRTPLHGIIGLQNLIASDQENLNAEQQEHLMLAQHAAQSLQELVNDILSLSKVESGAVELAEQPFALQGCLLKTVAPFIIACREKGLALNICLQDVPAMIVGDEVRLRQILINLIGNAVKFTHQGRIDVVVKQQDNKLVFQVEDTGIGIEESLLPRIFEPFLQAIDLMDGQHQGTGLGTTIAKRFVDLMGGHIQASSVLGEGSCFEFYILYGIHDEQRLSWQQDVAKTGVKLQTLETKAACDEMVGSQWRVLLAEDDPIAQIIAVKRFQRAGIRLDVAGDGLQAWQMLQEKKYDVLLTDIRMPKMDGLALTKLVRQHAATKDILIIGLSAHAMDEVAQACDEAGMHAFMVKPIDPDSVLRQVQDLMLLDSSCTD